METVRVHGLRQFMRAAQLAGPEARREVRGTLRRVGDVVKIDAAEKLSPLSRKSAAGYRVYVRQRGVAVEQSLRKVTGLRPDWGRTQMRYALEPALDEKSGEVEAGFELALDEIANYFERI